MHICVYPACAQECIGQEFMVGGKMTGKDYIISYCRFPKFHRVFSGRDPGTLKSDIVSNKHPRLICSDLRLLNWNFEDWNDGNRPYDIMLWYDIDMLCHAWLRCISLLEWHYCIIVLLIIIMVIIMCIYVYIYIYIYMYIYIYIHTYT